MRKCVKLALCHLSGLSMSVLVLRNSNLTVISSFSCAGVFWIILNTDMQCQRLLYKMLWLIGNVFKFIVGWYADLLFYLHMFVPYTYAWYNIFNFFRSHLLTELLWLSVVTTCNIIPFMCILFISVFLSKLPATDF